uniref:Uncharacterized protein n=1 Tax=Parascaris equorum TaxID=6256 RepID=A0A914RUT8_PAREQ
LPGQRDSSPQIVIHSSLRHNWIIQIGFNKHIDFPKRIVPFKIFLSSLPMKNTDKKKLVEVRDFASSIVSLLQNSHLHFVSFANERTNPSHLCVAFQEMTSNFLAVYNLQSPDAQKIVFRGIVKTVHSSQTTASINVTTNCKDSSVSEIKRVPKYELLMNTENFFRKYLPEWRSNMTIENLEAICQRVVNKIIPDCFDLSPERFKRAPRKTRKVLQNAGVRQTLMEKYIEDENFGPSLTKLLICIQSNDWASQLLLICWYRFHIPQHRLFQMGDLLKLENFNDPLKFHKKFAKKKLNNLVLQLGFPTISKVTKWNRKIPPGRLIACKVGGQLYVLPLLAVTIAEVGREEKRREERSSANKAFVLAENTDTRTDSWICTRNTQRSRVVFALSTLWYV